MKKVIVGGFLHESNSFNPIITGENEFVINYEEDIFNCITKNNSLSGIITKLQESGVEVFPSLYFRGVPNGVVDYNLYTREKNKFIEICKKITKQNKIDAFVLALHGSMRVEKIGEAEGDLLFEIKKNFPKLPIFVALDMHTTMTEKMHKNAEAFVSYKQAPHTDQTETGRQAAEMALKYFESGKLPCRAWVKIPFLIAGEKSGTDVEPMKSLVEELKSCEKIEGVQAASYLMGFPWSDNEDSSAASYVVADNQDLANQIAIELANDFWKKREDFVFVSEAYSPEESLNVVFTALKNKEKTPIYISDSGDNPTAGASSDNTNFLRLLVADSRSQDFGDILYAGFFDPEAVAICKKNIGREIELAFGGKYDNLDSKPVKLRGRVEAFVEKWNYSNRIFSDICLFKVGSIYVVLAEKHIGYTDTAIFEALGKDAKQASLVICKLGYLTPDHEKIAARKILATSDGNTPQDLENVDYKRVLRPIYPIDKNFSYKPSENLR